MAELDAALRRASERPGAMTVLHVRVGVLDTPPMLAALADAYSGR